MVRHYWRVRTTQLSKSLGNKKLSDQQVIELKEFWKNFVDIDFSEHKFYLNACNDFDVRYIPSSLHYTVIDKFFNNWEKARIVDNKTEYRRLFPDIKQPDTILTRCNGFWYNNELILHNIAIVDVILSNCPCFIKLATESEGGKGVYYIDKETNSEELIQLINKIKGDIIVQKALVQSSELSALNSSSVNTIRLMTLLKSDGTVKLCSACLRMGINGAKVDNASSGGIVAGIDENGCLKKYAYRPTGERFKTHPTSLVVFEHYQIPNFDKCKDVVLSLASHYPNFRLISWDIALDKDNEPVLIEANLCSGELDFHQLNNGPIFGDETKEILMEVFNRAM